MNVSQRLNTFTVTFLSFCEQRVEINVRQTNGYAEIFSAKDENHAVWCLSNREDVVRSHSRRVIDQRKQVAHHFPPVDNASGVYSSFF